MSAKDFVHLHVHSHYSLLDGACTIPALANLAKKHAMKALALTDHGNLFGVIQFYREMKAAQIKPIIGYEAYVAPGSRKDKQASGIKEAAHHLTLLAANDAGYRNLVKLSTAAYLEGFYYRPRIDLELLQAHKEGLIALSGCNSSEICQALLAGRPRDAISVASKYADLFGKENFFIEIQDNGLADQKVCLEGLNEAASKLGLQMVATNDIHYGAPEDAAAHEVLLCINTGKMLSDEGRMSFGSKEFYFKSAEEMQERFGRFKGAIENTAAIAERCDVKFNFEERHFPPYTPPGGVSAHTYLRKLCEEGLKRRLGEPSEEAKKRLEFELGVIKKMGYSSYFLVVWEIVHFAREKRIPAGLRGSGNSAIVCYALGISDIDPLKYSLLFERLLDPERREPPDLDIDICEVRRDEVIRYLHEKYGADNTAQIITFGTMKAKAAVKDVARVLGWSVPEADALSKRIPSTLNITLDAAMEQDESLRRDYQNDERMRQLWDFARKVEGLNRHASTHAAGMVIADKPLDEYIPLCKINDVVMSQFAMNDLEKAGMLKMDLLGLRTLTIVDKALDLIEARTGTRPDTSTLPLDDPQTYDLVGRGETTAVFQLGSSGMKELLRRLKPQNIEDLIAVVALFRPGPIQSGMIEDFIAARHGEKEIAYLDPSLEPILKDTCGVIVYQEQIMRILHELGGLSLGEALSTIKAISKKRSEEIDKRSEAFIKGAQKKGVRQDIAEAIFDLIRNFAQYGFNRSHTTPYAILSYVTAYLKAHYPMEFAAADLTFQIGHTDEFKEHIRDCSRLGINILPPSVNEGAGHFTVCDNNAIRFGMLGVRSVGERAVEAIISARERGDTFRTIQDFCERVESSTVNRQALESLVKAGAFDALPGNRAQKVAVLEDAMRSGARAQLNRRRGQKSLFGAEAGGAAVPEASLPPIEEWPLAELGRYEKEALGMRLSFNPQQRHRRILSELTTAAASGFKGLKDRTPVIIGGEVVSVRPLLTKGGHAMAQVEIEDLTGIIKCVVFPEAYEKHSGIIKEEAFVFAFGTVDATGDRPSIRVQEVVPIEQAPARLTESLRLSIQRDAVNANLLDELQRICHRHSGDLALIIELTEGEKPPVMLKTGLQSAVRPCEELVDELTELLGEGHVKLIPREPASLVNGNGGNGKFKRMRNQ